MPLIIDPIRYLILNVIREARGNADHTLGALLASGLLHPLGGEVPWGSADGTLGIGDATLWGSQDYCAGAGPQAVRVGGGPGNGAPNDDDTASGLNCHTDPGGPDNDPLKQCGGSCPVPNMQNGGR